ncbi:MAG: hypothetical protein QM728_08745 [Gordonia sp. (in: high G+C Gram-positive bacteria)]|uniref:hypothetical protein n=1 Tax=Gordonia sp. (in: high G+C Gram-positive bacteria) TaxID=84139 RepID=UPI0039E3F87C
MAAFGLLVAGLVTGGLWLAIACVVASVIGLVLLVVDIRRSSKANAVEDAPTTGAFLGEDVDAYVAQREARRETGAFAAVAGTGALSRVGGTGSLPPVSAYPEDGGWREQPRPADDHPEYPGPPELPDYPPVDEYPGGYADPAPRPYADSAAGWRDARPAAPLPDFDEIEPAVPVYPPDPTRPVPDYPPFPGASYRDSEPADDASAAEPAAPSESPAPVPEPGSTVSGPAFPMPTVTTPSASEPAPGPWPTEAPPAWTPPEPPADPAPWPAPAAPSASTPPSSPAPAPRSGPVGDLRDYVTSTGSIPRIENTGSIPTVVGDTPPPSPEPAPAQGPTVRWEASIPPTPGLVTDESREEIAHVNDLPPTPPRRRRPPTDPRGTGGDPLNPNWRPPAD